MSQHHCKSVKLDFPQVCLFFFQFNFMGFPSISFFNHQWLELKAKIRGNQRAVCALLKKALRVRCFFLVSEICFPQYANPSSFSRHLMYSSSWLLVFLRPFISLAMFEMVLCISLMRLFFSASKFACAALHSSKSFCKDFTSSSVSWHEAVGLQRCEILEFFLSNFSQLFFPLFVTFAALFSNWLYIYCRTSISFLMASAWAGADISVRSGYISFLLSSVKKNLGFWPSLVSKNPLRPL